MIEINPDAVKIIKISNLEGVVKITVGNGETLDWLKSGFNNRVKPEEIRITDVHPREESNIDIVAVPNILQSKWRQTKFVRSMIDSMIYNNYTNTKKFPTGMNLRFITNQVMAVKFLAGMLTVHYKQRCWQSQPTLRNPFLK